MAFPSPPRPGAGSLRRILVVGVLLALVVGGVLLHRSLDLGGSKAPSRVAAADGPRPLRTRSGDDGVYRPCPLGTSIFCDAGALAAGEATAEDGPLDGDRLAEESSLRGPDLDSAVFDETIARLEAASRQWSLSSREAAELAVAFWARGEATGEAVDLARAWQWATRAVAADPLNPSALFDHAAILTRLRMNRAAIEAWGRYLAVDFDSGWADEVRAILVTLTPTAMEETPDVRDLMAFDESAYRIAVAELPPSMMAEAERLLLEAWAYGAGGDPLGRLRRLGAVLEQRTGDPILVQTVKAIDAATPEERVILARAHRDYAKARAHYGNRDCDRARPAFVRVARVFEAASSPYQQWSEYHEAICKYRDNAMDEADASFASLEVWAAENQSPRLRGYVALMRGLVALERGDFSTGMARYGVALEHYEKAQLPDLEAHLRMLQADALSRLGEAGGALEILLPLLDSIEGLVGPQNQKVRLVVAIYGELADALEELEAYPEALVARGQSLALAKTLDEPELLVAEILYSRAQTRERLGGRAGAAADLREARRQLAGVRDSSSYAMVEAGIQAVEGRIGVGEGIGAGLGEITGALEYYEEVGARLLLPSLHLQRARLHLSSDAAEEGIADLERAVSIGFEQREGIDEDTWRIEYGAATRGALEMLIDQRYGEGTFHEELVALADQLRDVDLFAPTMVNGEKSAPKLTIPRASTQGVALVSYTVLPTRLLIWTLTASGSEWTEVEVERSQLDRWVEDVADLKRPLAETKAVRSELYRCLVEPIGGRLEGADVVILAPDRPLHRLAFPFLRGPEEAAPFLIDEHALVVTPSVTATLAETLAASVTQTHRAPLSEGEVLVVGEPQLSEVRVEKLGGLPMAGVEAKALKDRYPDARVLLGANADRERLLAHLPNARIFHFAGHALAHPDPNSTRLVLAGDLADRPQGLFASEIRRLELEGLELVVLSACDTARTRDADVSGTLSLAAPFLVAGARHVVATLGPVDDRLAAKVSVGLHQQISQGSSPAQALRAVQNELARGSSRGEWASFRVLGHRH